MQILATDFDGTLFRNNTVTEADLSAIRRFQKAGNKFGIVTGRHLPSILKEAEMKAVPFDFLICCTGGILLDAQKNILAEHKAPREAVLPLYRETRAFGGMYFCVSVGMERLWYDTGFPPVYDDLEILPESALSSLSGFHEMGTRFPDEQTAARYVQTLNQTYPDLLSAHQNGIYIDVCAPHTSKVTGLYEILTHFHAAENDLSVVGDNLNDLEMIQAFHSFAVKSGRRELQAAADHTVSDFSEIVEILL